MELLMKKEIVKIQNIAKGEFPFNHVVKAGEFLFLTSQLSCDLVSGKLLKGSIAEQTHNAMVNIAFLLDNAGSSIENIVDVTVYLRNTDDFDEMNSAYKDFFKSGEEPARVVVKAESPLDGVDVEIKVTAIIDSHGDNDES